MRNNRLLNEYDDGLKAGYLVGAVPEQRHGGYRVLLSLSGEGVVDAVEGVELTGINDLYHFAYQEWESCFV